MFNDINEYISAAEGLDRVRGNNNLYKKLLGMFLGGKEFEKFQAAVAAGDMDSATSEIHTLKGVAGNLALKKLFEESVVVLAELRSGVVNNASISQIAVTYEKTCNAVKAYIEMP
ncbi:MAG: Hpt domain-containing protein [Oscillospiraceae bacterium]|nr:Hpt domain-containing protein [Oscillospiraceae bacterium]